MTRNSKAELAALAATSTVQARRIEAGASNGMSNRDWYRASRDPVAERHVAAVDHMGREWIVNGLGEVIAAA